MNKLRIYACSGVSDNGSTALFTNEGTNALTNTQAMNKLLSLINMCAADSQLVTTSPEEKADCYRDMNVYSVCFYFAQLYAGDDKKLMEAGYAINQYMEDGKFAINSKSLEDHGQRVDEIIAGVQQLIDTEAYKQQDSIFISWFRDNVIAYNHCGLTKEQIEKAEAVKPKPKRAQATSWQDNEDLNTYLNDAGTYFIYTYFTEEQLRKVPAIMRIKRKKQLEVYEYCKQAFVPIYGTEEDMRRIIANGIKFKFKESPEDVCYEIATGKDVIGDPAAIITAIATLIGVLVSVLSVVLSFCASIVAAQYTVPEDPSAGIATDSDFENWEPESSKSKVWLWIAGAAAAALLLIK